jgi:hypothetical protein
MPCSRFLEELWLFISCFDSYIGTLQAVNFGGSEYKEMPTMLLLLSSFQENQLFIPAALFKIDRLIGPGVTT